MSTFQWLTFIIDALTDESYHFLLAFVSGLLGFWWTWITLFATLSGLEHLIRRRTSTAVAYGIVFCCLLAGFSFALGSHWALDYVSMELSKPLGPPLKPGGDTWLLRCLI